MDWKQVWLQITTSFPSEFKRWVETEYPGGPDSIDLAAITQSLNTVYQTWQTGSGATATGTNPTSAAGPSGGGPEISQDPKTGQWFRWSASYDAIGKPMGGNWIPFDPPKPAAPTETFTNLVPMSGYYFAQFTSADGSTRIDPNPLFSVKDTGLTEAQKLDREAFDYRKQQDELDRVLAERKMAQDIAAQNAAIKDRYAQGQAYSSGVLAGAQNMAGEEWGRERPPITSAGTGPQDWVNIWKAQQANIDPRTGTAWQSRADYANRAQANITPENMARLQAATNVDTARQQVWDVNSQQMRPETEQEYIYRTRTVPIRDLTRGEQVNPASFGIGPGGEAFRTSGVDAQGNPIRLDYITATENRLGEAAAGNPLSSVQNIRQNAGLAETDRSAFASLSPVQQEAVNRMATEENAARVAEWQRSNPQRTGPEIPDWARSVVQAGSKYLNVNTLGRPGNVIRPVGAGTYQSWTPSQRQGYAGLVGAQKGTYAPDYLANLETMWGASRPGQQARRRSSWL